MKKYYEEPEVDTVDILVDDIKHRMWAGFWVNTVFFRRVKRFCLKCRKKKQNLDKNKSC